MGYRDRLHAEGPRKLLALDGGGIRGVLTLEILSAIEDIVRTKLGKDAVLADYFDYVAGTSTGAVIAAGLSRGLSVDEIRTIYHQHGKEMFDRALILGPLPLQVRQLAAAAAAAKVVRREHHLRGRRAQDIADGRAPQRDDRLAMAVDQQPRRHLQCPRAGRLQPQVPAVAAGARQHGRPDVLPARADPGRRSRPCVRRRGSHHVQQPGLPAPRRRPTTRCDRAT